MAQNEVEEFWLTTNTSEIATFDPQNVLNFDETELLYCKKPKSTISSTTIHGTKQAKVRITIALCTKGARYYPYCTLVKVRNQGVLERKPPSKVDIVITVMTAPG